MTFKLKNSLNETREIQWNQIIIAYLYDLCYAFDVDTVKQKQIHPLGVNKNSSHGRTAKQSCVKF